MAAKSPERNLEESYPPPYMVTQSHFGRNKVNPVLNDGKDSILDWICRSLIWMIQFESQQQKRQDPLRRDNLIGLAMTQEWLSFFPERFLSRKILHRARFKPKLPHGLHHGLRMKPSFLQPFDQLAGVKGRHIGASACDKNNFLSLLFYCKLFSCLGVHCLILIPI